MTGVVNHILLAEVGNYQPMSLDEGIHLQMENEITEG